MSVETENLKPIDHAGDAGPKEAQRDLSRELWSGVRSDKAKGDAGKKRDGAGPLDLSLGSLYKSVHGKQAVDGEKIDKLAESLHKESGADSTVKALSHTNREKVFELLKGTTQEERSALQDKYKDKYKQSLDKEYDFLSGSDKDKFNALLHKKDGDVGGQGADRIKAALDESHEVTGRSKAKCAQDIRDTLATMNSKQIEEAKQSYHEKYNRDGKGLELVDAIKSDAAVPQATKDAVDIYMKGVDKRTDKDALALADIGLKDKNITMFQESMTQASAEARQAFMKNGGDDKLKAAFAGHWYNAVVGGEKGSDANITDKELERARDLVKYGKESTAQQIKDNTGYISNNTEAIDQSLARMTVDERKSYVRGKELAEKKVEPKDESDKKALSYYKELHDSLNKVNLYTHDADMARWEDMISRKDGGMIAKIGAHRGTIYNDSASAVSHDIEGIDKGEWQRLHNLKNGKNADGSEAKSDADKKHNMAEYQHHKDELSKALNGLKGGRIGDDDIKKMTDMFNRKMDSGTFEDSQKVRRSFEQTINDDTHWYSNDRRALLDDIAHMSKEEQAKYRDDPAFKAKVDDLIRGYTGTFKAGPARDGAEHMLDNIAAGKEPEDALAKMYMRTQERLEGDAKKNAAAGMLAIPTGGLSALANAGDSLAGNRGQAALLGSSSADAVRDLQDAFKKDPELRERILHPKSDAEKAYSEKFFAATKGAMSGSDFDNYAKPLIETGHLTIEQQMDLNKGLISNDKPGAFKDILTATPEEKQRILTDAAYQDKVLGFLSKDDREVALNALKQGKMAAEDEIRSRLNHVGGSDEIMNTLRNIPPDQLDHVRHEYNRKYGSDLEASLIEKLGSDKRPEMERMFQKHANATEAYNDARDEYYRARDGFGSKFVDGVNSGTGHQLDDVMQQYGKEVAEAHKHYTEMSPAQQRVLHEQFAASIKNFRESKEAAADYSVDAAIAAGAIGGIIATGGASTPLVVGLAAAGAAAKVGGKAAILGADYDLTASQIGIDALSGAASGATSVIGPGEIAGAFKVGEKAAEQAAKATLKEIAEQAAKKAATEALESGAKTVLKEGGEQIIQDGTKQIMKEALAHGAKELDEKAIQALAEKAVAKELIGDARKQAVKEVTEGLQKNLAQGFKEETASWLKNMAREGALNAGAGAAGGGIAGGINGASQWDGSKSFRQNMSHIGESVAMSAASGAGGAIAMTGVMKGVGAAWNGLHGRAVEVLPKENAGLLPRSEIRRPAPDNLFFDNGMSMTRRNPAGSDGAETWWVHGPNGDAKVFRGTVEHTGDGKVVMKAHASGSTIILNSDGSVAKHIPGDAIISSDLPNQASSNSVAERDRGTPTAAESRHLPPHIDSPGPIEPIVESVKSTELPGSKGIRLNGKIDERVEALIREKQPLDYKSIIPNDSKVVVFGELHSAQGTHNALASSMSEFKEMGFTHLAVEALSTEQQPVIDAYYKGAVSRDTMMATLKEHWGWDATGYMNLIDAAKDNGIKIMAVDKNIPSALQQSWEAAGKDAFEEASRIREKQWAQLVNDEISKRPDSRVMMLVGMRHAGIYPEKSDALTTLLNAGKPTVVNLTAPSASPKWSPSLGDFDQVAQKAGVANQPFAVRVKQPGFRPCDYVINLPPDNVAAGRIDKGTGARETRAGEAFPAPDRARLNEADSLDDGWE